LKDLSRRPRRGRSRREEWWPRLQKLRPVQLRWGARKLRWVLQTQWPRRHVPSVRTVHRWLAEAGWVQPPRQLARRGPVRRLPGRLSGRRANDVWTVDFKGCFRTKDGAPVEPLTVRDLASRYGLAVRILPAKDERSVRRILAGLFRRHGLPKAIRIDNGPPFGGQGPRGLTRLSAWWLGLGIRVEFGRPGSPQDNAAHEQWHAVLAKETTRPAARSPRAQQRRFERWLKRYNQQRPHEALGLRVPAALYRSSPRKLPALRPIRYPRHWSVRQLDARGCLRWSGRTRVIGRAFAGLHVGLKPKRPGCWEVYLKTHFLGLLIEHDPAGLRPVQWRKPLRRAGPAQAPARRV
jgi:transposase InsO family protein